MLVFSQTFVDDIPASLHRILGLPLESIPLTQVRIDHTTGGIVYNDRKEIGTFEVVLGGRYLGTIEADTRSKEAEGIVLNQVALQVLYTPQFEGFPSWFKDGASDYVRIKMARESPRWPTRLYGGNYTDGWRTTGYFLKWIEEDEDSPKPWTVQQILKTPPRSLAPATSSHETPLKELSLQNTESVATWSDQAWEQLWTSYQLSVLKKNPDVNVTTHRPRPSEPLMILIDEGGSEALLQAVPDPLHFLTEAYLAINGLLYPTSSFHQRKVPCVTLILSPKADGVASTENAVITFAMSYVNNYSKSHNDAALTQEIKGILLHEMVHVLQYSGTTHSAPSGIIEGIADYCRLRSGWGAAHWSQGPGGKWDSGYQVTGYFLDWLEKERGFTEFVAKCNETLRENPWDEGWCEVETGLSWSGLWEDYQAGMKPTGTGTTSRVEPTHI
ncbi:hypothetical protein FRB95_012086 [Tulasnella sp. JGI-2019a]|nr:hypothetical protein FRB95_012086 [Tulasnella sp. JGI-2019a]